MPESRKYPRPVHQFLRITDVAEYLSVSRGVVEGWLNRGLLPCYELPGTGKGEYRFRRIALKDLKAFLDKYFSGHHAPKKRKPKIGKLKLLPRNGNVEKEKRFL